MKRYTESLQRQKNQRDDDQRTLKRRITGEEIKVVVLKRRMLLSEIGTVSSEAHGLALKAQKESNFSCRSQSNQKQIMERKAGFDNF